MRHIAIVGSGPAGFYTAEAALKALGEAVRIDIIDRLPTPYGLIRAGVAPDHQSIKAVARRYEAVGSDQRVRFIGHVAIGEDVSVAELCAVYHDVVLATGAPEDRTLGIEGDDLPGVVGSSDFVGWYNGHPTCRNLAPPLESKAVAIVGNGNVAIDCARILAKTVSELQGSDIVNHALDPLGRSAVEQIHILGRRGPHQASFTMKEVGELGQLARATPVVRAEDLPPLEADAGLETGQRRVVETLRRFAAAGPDSEKPVTITLDFFRRPVRVVGTNKVEAIELAKTTLDDAGRVVDTGDTIVLPVGMVITAIGYRTSAIPDVPFDEGSGRFRNENGLIAPGLWCVGWARRGPTGTIGTNRTDGYALVERLVATAPAPDRPGGNALDRLMDKRDVSATHFGDWQRIDAAEVARARPGAPREKIVALDEFRRVIATGN